MAAAKICANYTTQNYNQMECEYRDRKICRKQESNEPLSDALQQTRGKEIVKNVFLPFY